MKHNLKLKIAGASALGIIIPIALVYLITDMFSTYMNLYNLGIFLMIFIIGAIGLVILFIGFQMLRRKALSKEFVGKRVFHSLALMNIVLIIFGFVFYDYSKPKPTSFGMAYQHEYTTPKQMEDDWGISSLAQVGMETDIYNNVINKLANDKAYKRMHSFLIIKNGKLVAEDYFYEYDKDTPHDLRSANKAITSILMGIAIDQGLIKNVDQKVSEFFLEYDHLINWGANKHELTIKHLLTMNTGLDCNDWSRSSLGNENELYKTDDWIKAFLALPFKEKAGTKFSYCTFGEIIARTIIVKASGMSMQEFAKKHLFEPLKITNYTWAMLMPNRDDIGIRVSLTPRDFAKLGQLYLNEGIWDTKQIVSSKWVRNSVSTHTVTTERRLGYPEYGFLWWKNQFEIGGKQINGYQALGNGGQLLFVFPSLDMVIVFTAGNYGNPRMLNAFKILENDILPLIIK